MLAYEGRLLLDPKEARETGHALIAEANKHVTIPGALQPQQQSQHIPATTICQRCGQHTPFYYKCGEGHEHEWCPAADMAKSQITINDCLIVCGSFDLFLIPGTIGGQVNRNTIIPPNTPMAARLWKSFHKGKAKGI